MISQITWNWTKSL